MIDLRTAREQLRPLDTPLVDAYKAAIQRWAELIDDSAHLALPLDATARANFIHPHVCREVQIRVADVAGVEPTDALGFFALRIGHDILLRFKHVGGGIPRNYKTRQQRLLAGQTYDTQMVFALTGDPALTPPTLLTAGYTLDGKTLARVEIRRDCIGHQPWTYDIFGGTSVTEPLIIDSLEDTTKPATVISIRTGKAVDDAEQAEQQ